MTNMSSNSLFFALVFMGSTLSAKAQVQIRSIIRGEAIDDQFGWSVSMPDDNTVAIGAPKNDGIAENAGHVRIYTLTSDPYFWIQKGADIDGEAVGDNSGTSVSMPDANTVAIGSPNSDRIGILPGRGHVRVYSWSGSAWVQKGGDIDGEAIGDGSGCSVSMPDANTLAIGAPNNDGGSDAGHVRVYTWSGTAWVQKGVDIDGEDMGDRSGYSVSMPDANTLAIGAYFARDGNGFLTGHVRVYSWNGTAWAQKGVDIDGEAAYDYSGHSVSMPDANTVAIGAFRNVVFSNNGQTTTTVGHVRVYTWSGAAWIQIGVDIDGQVFNEQFGWSVSMPDANTVAIGAPDYKWAIQNQQNKVGAARVYSLGTVDVSEKSIDPSLNLYPNPAWNILNVKVDSKYFHTAYSIYDNTGRIVLTGKLQPEVTSIEVGSLSTGVYTFKVGEDIHQTFTVNRE